MREKIRSSSHDAFCPNDMRSSHSGLHTNDFIVFSEFHISLLKKIGFLDTFSSVCNQFEDLFYVYCTCENICFLELINFVYERRVKTRNEAQCYKKLFLEMRIIKSYYFFQKLSYHITKYLQNPGNPRELNVVHYDKNKLQLQ